MTPLVDYLRISGPVSVEAFMALALGHPVHGYYRSRSDILGRAGDFTTAPEISQVFGELLGLWAAVGWQAMGSPSSVDLIELGPGRGTLMVDAMRAARVVPGFQDRLELHLVETSEPLRAAQAAALSETNMRVDWHPVLPLLKAPTIILANEFLDALPIDQLVFEGGFWRRRMVASADDGELSMIAGETVAVPAARMPSSRPPRDGDVLELRPGAERLIHALATAAARFPLLALFIDYGFQGPAFGDTLQAVSGHGYVDPLQRPGEVDLSSLVDFGSLGRLATQSGARAFGPVPQAAFLGELGIAERTRRLVLGKPAKLANEIETATARLLAPSAMGGRFQAFAIASAELPPAAGFGASTR